MAKKPFPFKVCEQCCGGDGTGGGENYVDKTTEQTIYAKKTFMSPITVYGDVLVPNGKVEISDGTISATMLSMRNGKFEIDSTSVEGMYFNGKRTLTETDKTEIDTRLSSAEGELGLKASIGAVAELETKKADKETTEWQLIESVTLEQDVKQLHCDLKGGQYKELYIRFTIPTLNPDNSSDFPKGRVQVFGKGYTALFEEGNYPYTDSGKDWLLTYHLTMMGNNCVGERKIYETGLSAPYAIGYNNTRWAHNLGAQLENNFISELWFNMLPSDTWKFSVGTTYELWGVKA